MSIQATATLRPTAPTCEAKLRMFDPVSTLPPYCQRTIALGSFLDAQGVRRFHCQAEGHREKVAQLYGRAALDEGVAVFDAPPAALTRFPVTRLTAREEREEMLADHELMADEMHGRSW